MAGTGVHRVEFLQCGVPVKRGLFPDKVASRDARADINFALLGFRCRPRLRLCMLALARNNSPRAARTSMESRLPFDNSRTNCLNGAKSLRSFTMIQSV